jgi:hypothetical protein
MQRKELEADSRVRLMDPTSPTRPHSGASSQRAASSHGNSPQAANDDQQQQQQQQQIHHHHSSGTSVNDFLRLESCVVRAEIAARRVEECTSQCRLIMQQVFCPHLLTPVIHLTRRSQVENLATIIQRSHADAVGSVEDAARAAAGWGSDAIENLQKVTLLQLTAKPCGVLCQKPRFFHDSTTEQTISIDFCCRVYILLQDYANACKMVAAQIGAKARQRHA